MQKITILPRGRALGYTMVLPENDKYSNTRAELLDQLAYMMGGRAAEELVFHDPTTGASNDIEKATSVAKAMVTQYGMTERLGAIKLGTGDSEPFLGRDYGQGRDYSEEIAAVVDEEISRLISTAHQEAFDILTANRDVLDDLVRALFEHETLDRAAVAGIFQNLRLWPKRPAWTGSDSRVPSELPPVTPPPPRLVNGVDGQRGLNGSNGSHANGSNGNGSGHQPGGEGVPAGGAPIPPGSRPCRRSCLRVRRAVARCRRAVPTSAEAASPAGPRSPSFPLGEDGTVSRLPDPTPDFELEVDENPPDERPPVDEPRIAAAVREILFAIGEDPERDGLIKTPERVARAYTEMFAGLRQDPADVLATTFDLGHDELVLVKDIEVWSSCEHHLVPFTGVAHIGYIPKQGRPDHRPVQARPARRHLRQAAAGPGTDDHADRRRPGALPLAPGRHRRHRVRAPLHDDAWCPQATAPGPSPAPYAATSAPAPPPAPRR